MSLWLFLASREASACGGFACDQVTPVLQDAERIVFAVEDGTVEMHVQITYDGDADAFAWIVPVPSHPEVFLTTDLLFERLERATAPTFRLTTAEEGRCRSSSSFGCAKAESTSGDTGTADSSSRTDEPVVVGEENVGAYEVVALEATSVDGLLTWLDLNGYGLPADAEAAIAPYVTQEGATFLALRLEKGADKGDLAPLAIRYAGDLASVPVQLTSVSAVPDMRMEVYVFGDTRAVPESYLHVEVNEAAIDWWSGGQNYFDVIARAADEAGGHAFATDYYGTSDVAGQFFDEAAFDEAELRAQTQASNWLSLVLRAAPATPEMVDLLQDVFGVSRADAERMVQSSDYAHAAAFVDSVDAATDALMERVIEPLRASQRLVDDHPLLTRLTSSLDAAEMTIDPTFVLNADMLEPQVSNAHLATMVYECGGGRRPENAQRRLQFASGVEIPLPSERWFARNARTEAAYVEEFGGTKALRIQQTGRSGLPQILKDGTEDLQALAEQIGSGCDASGELPGSLAALALVGAVALRRRRP